MVVVVSSTWLVVLFLELRNTYQFASKTVLGLILDQKWQRSLATKEWKDKYGQLAVNGLGCKTDEVMSVYGIFSSRENCWSEPNQCWWGARSNGRLQSQANFLAVTDLLLLPSIFWSTALDGQPAGTRHCTGYRCCTQGVKNERLFNVDKTKQCAN